MDTEKAREYVSDITITDESSSCCGAQMYEFGDSYMCCECREYCDAVSDDEDKAYSFAELSEMRKSERVFSNDQLAQIERFERQCRDAGCEGPDHKCND